MSIARLELDTSSPVPLYHQLAQQLRAAIDSGAVQEGDPLESTRVLSGRLRLSRDTVVHAHRILVSTGYAVRVGSRGLTARLPPSTIRDALAS